MPHSVDEAAQIAEQLEREAHDQIVENPHRLDEVVKLLREALAIREAYQGEAHPDLIWTLSLWIYALRRKHRPESALEAARLGDRRLALRRTALAGAPDELAHSLRELIDIYTFEDHVLDTRRVDELRRELAACLEAGGAQREA
jgi:alkanesulfonate monooxygenase SsuD/methylene tetrahydromethanopterin reductase-like flavin-dependent oxidoreductase (luciferase family)